VFVQLLSSVMDHGGDEHRDQTVLMDLRYELRVKDV